jgi:NAD(P)-dependent dehydrogenase (short-subunit alcohol dehydrogenase family)
MEKVVIAGGSTGIGQATAAILAGNRKVIITGRSEQKLQQALSALPAGVAAQAVDSNDTGKLKDFMTATGPIDHLVLSLGGSKGLGAFNTLDLGAVREGFEEKFFPQLQTLQVALPYLVAGGSVTFITAVSGHARFPGIAGIGAINAALEAIVPMLAKELKPVRVNAVSPGAVDTPWWSFLPADPRKEAFEQYAQASLVGRVGKPEDIASLIAHLINNTFITGQVITIDGGLGL